jgi:hypothetical protein
MGGQAGTQVEMLWLTGELFETFHCECTKKLHIKLVKFQTVHFHEWL